VLNLAVQGKSNAAVAARLGVRVAWRAREKVPAMSEAGGRVGTGEGAADQQGVPRRGGADRSEAADHALRVDARGPPG